jgi:hypothetical protein
MACTEPGLRNSLASTRKPLAALALAAVPSSRFKTISRFGASRGFMDFPSDINVDRESQVGPGESLHGLGGPE